MQSLQADQSLYNRIGVCYIVHVIGRFQVIRRLYLLIRDCKYNQNINNSSQNQYKSYPNSPQIEKTHFPGHRTPICVK